MSQDKAAAAPVSDPDRRQQDPRWLRTREAIVRAGFRLFAQHLPDGVSMDELIREAGVSKQSFYNHFIDKDELARHILEITRAEIDRRATEANRGVTDPAQRLAVGLCMYAKLLVDEPEKGWVVARLGTQGMVTEAAMNRPLADDVRAGIADGRLACFSPDTGIAFVIGAALSLGWRVLLDGNRANAPITIQQFVTLTLRAFGLPPIEAELIASQAVDRILRAPATEAAAGQRESQPG
jgi:AcrR family transcriptional regulator